MMLDLSVLDDSPPISGPGDGGLVHYGLSDPAFQLNLPIPAKPILVSATDDPFDFSPPKRRRKAIDRDALDGWGTYSDGSPFIYDNDGIVVSERYTPAVTKWGKLPLGHRQKISESYLASRASELKKAAAPRRKATGLKAFSTLYARQWVRDMGWGPVIASEAQSAKTGRMHDAAMGMDLIVHDKRKGRLVAVQAGNAGANNGKGEHDPHFERFIDRDGPLLAATMRCAVVYVEFNRGRHTPARVTWWVGGE